MKCFNFYLNTKIYEKILSEKNDVQDVYGTLSFLRLVCELVFGKVVF